MKLCSWLVSARRPLKTGPIILDKTKLYEPECDGTPLRVVMKELATTAVKETFNIDQSDFSFSIDAVVDRLVICSGNELYNSIFNLAQEPGKK